MWQKPTAESMWILNHQIQWEKWGAGKRAKLVSLDEDEAKRRWEQFKKLVKRSKEVILGHQFNWNKAVMSGKVRNT